MGREASYGKTRRNNATEDQALNVLLLADRRFQRLDARMRNRVLELLGLQGQFTNRVFDLVRTQEPLPPLGMDDLDSMVETLTLVEVKATKAPIADETLAGFFFGATENEYRIAERLGSRYQFAFVVLNPPAQRTPFHVLLTLQEVQARTRTKRIQFQVNFQGKTGRRAGGPPA
jgi:hypothetical protein